MKEFLFRDAKPIPLEIADTEGSYLIDAKGRRYLDFVMGWCVGNAGWKKSSILSAIRSFNGPTYAMPSCLYSRWDELAKRLVSLLPNKSGACFKATGGTEAVEIALKISRAYNRRSKFIAFRNAYHGQSLACLSLVGIHEDKFGPYQDSYIRIDAENWDRTTGEVVKTIRKGDICAFISEPIICNLGIVIPPRSFFDAVAEVCADTDTLLIMDEVATGFGRTGRWFGFEHYGLEPDIVTIAKGFSSGYAGIGAAMAKPEVAEAMRFDFSNYSTYGWHPISTECAIANIDYMKKEGLVKKSEESGKFLMKRLSDFCEPEGRGLCVGFEMKNKNIEADCLKGGLFLSGLNNRVTLFPALDVSRAEIDKAVEIIRKHY